MMIFSRSGMEEEINMVRALQKEARTISKEAWPDWVNAHKDKIRLSGADGYVPDRKEWIKRCEYFLVCMGATSF